MIKGVIPWILRAESALNFIDTSILVFYHQGRQGRTDIRLRPRPAWPPRPPAPEICEVLNRFSSFSGFCPVLLC